MLKYKNIKDLQRYILKAIQVGITSKLLARYPGNLFLGAYVEKMLLLFCGGPLCIGDRNLYWNALEGDQVDSFKQLTECEIIYINRSNEAFLV